MKRLKEFQKEFMDLVRERGGDQLLPTMQPIGNLNSQQVVGVYQDDYFARLTEALGETFESCWMALGDDDFFKAARHYIETHPSQVRDLNEYGDQFGEFLQAHYSEGMEWIGELAKFEWDFWTLFHKEGFQQADAFEGVDQEKLIGSSFVFQDNLMLRSWDNALFNIWKNRDNPDVDGDELNLDQAQYVVLYKSCDQMDVQGQELSLGQYQILSRLLEGVTLGECLSQVEISDPAEVSEFFEFLRLSGIVKKLN